MMVYRDEPGLAPNSSQTRFSHNFFDPFLDPLFSQSDAPRLPKGTPKAPKMVSKMVSGSDPKGTLIFLHFFTRFSHFFRNGHVPYT